MKFMPLYLKMFALSMCVILTQSCSDQIESDGEESQLSSHLPDSIHDKVLELNGDPKDFQFNEITQVDGSVVKFVTEVGADAGILADEFLKQSDKKQYRTQFIVDTKRFRQIDIYGFTGIAPFGLTAQSQRALRSAVDNWNRVNLTTIRLNLVFSSSTNVDPNVFETLVTAQENLGSSGLALFPTSDGTPGRIVNVDNQEVNRGNWSADAIEHIFTHELGHTLGFRHTDWQTRRSCVEAGLSNVEQTEEFAELLPWTLPNIPPYLYQDNSIMNACFNIFTTNGELNQYDILGLQNMYFDPFYGNDGF